MCEPFSTGGCSKTEETRREFGGQTMPGSTRGMVEELYWLNTSMKLPGHLVRLALLVLGVTSGSQMDASENKCS